MSLNHYPAYSLLKKKSNEKIKYHTYSKGPSVEWCYIMAHTRIQELNFCQRGGGGGGCNSDFFFSF